MNKLIRCIKILIMAGATVAAVSGCLIVPEGGRERGGYEHQGYFQR
jgi:hypothetical protein